MRIRVCVKADGNLLVLSSCATRVEILGLNKVYLHIININLTSNKYWNYKSNKLIKL